MRYHKAICIYHNKQMQRQAHANEKADQYFTVGNSAQKTTIFVRWVRSGNTFAKQNIHFQNFPEIRISYLSHQLVQMLADEPRVHLTLRERRMRDRAPEKLDIVRQPGDLVSARGSGAGSGNGRAE